MTTPQIIVTALSGSACFGCLVGGLLLLADWRERRAIKSRWPRQNTKRPLAPRLVERGALRRVA